MSSWERDKEIKMLNEIHEFSKRHKPAINKTYNIYERAYEMMNELVGLPLPLEPEQLANLSDRELEHLKGCLELMTDYMDSLGFDFRHRKEEVLVPIYEEMNKRY